MVNSWNFWPYNSTSLCHTCVRKRMPNSCMNQRRRKECVSDDDAKWGERSRVFIQVVEGEVTRPLGFVSLHDDVADLNNLHVSGHKFKNTPLLVQIRWSLYQFWSSRKEEFNAIIISIKWAVPRWNLALVANLNTYRSKSVGAINLDEVDPASNWFIHTGGSIQRGEARLARH